MPSSLVRLLLALTLAAPLACARPAPRSPSTEALPAADPGAAPAADHDAAHAVDRRPVSDDDLRGELDELTVVRAIVSRSPSLGAHAHRVRSIVASARAAGALPPPTAMVTLWQAPLHTPFVYGDSAMLMLGIEQMFPPGAALSGETRAMEEDARAHVAMMQAHERDLVLRATRLFLDYRAAARRERVLARQRALITSLEGAARARLSTGGSVLSDLARIEVDAAKLDGEVVATADDKARARGEINALLGRPPSAELGPPAEHAPEVPAASVDEALALARRTRHELAAGRAMERREGERAQIAEAIGSRPTFSVGLVYGLSRQSGMPDTWGASFSTTLPWLSSAPAAQAEAARSAREGARLDVDALSLDIDREVAEAYGRVTAAARRIAILRTRVEPATARAVEAARAGYVAGPGDVMPWLDALRGRLDVSLALADGESALERALADLDRTTAKPLPRRPLSDEEVLRGH